MSASPSRPQGRGGGSTQPVHSPLPTSMWRTLGGEAPKVPHGPGEGTGPWVAPWSRPWPHYAKSRREPSARGAEMPGHLDSNTRGHLGLCVCPDGTVRRSVMSDSATQRDVALQAPLSMGFSR
ncbi:unnamed protein product [Rangifer tarandus platyrhynchus]|uniref:Uncharacterized protein n=1 Tax=Rangifer tarandus platyrhynchus TaxID=3082113 RepID=A0ACB1MK02_RANTA